MRSAFGTVIWIVCATGLLAAVMALITTRKTWEEYGKSRLLLERDLAAARPSSASAAALRERDDEIRQLLEARNTMRARRGESPLDIERELARLTGSQIDAGLRSEIRELVVARNHRRARSGKPPLDVEAEVEREIAQLGELYR